MLKGFAWLAFIGLSLLVACQMTTSTREPPAESFSS